MTPLIAPEIVQIIALFWKPVSVLFENKNAENNAILEGIFCTYTTPPPQPLLPPQPS